MSSARADPKALAREIGHDFADRRLLTGAITHGSARTAGAGLAFQRLEFLGDRVIGLIVADMLHQLFPRAEEGELARRFNDLVRRETLADIARDIDLGSYLVLGPGEAQAGGRDKDAILADACEAVFAAVYLDGGLDAARRFAERLWSGRIRSQSHAPSDPKTRLQEWTQARGAGLPDYVETGRSGPPHAPSFTVEVRVAGLEPAHGEGASKREAERNAAQALLDREAVAADD